VRQINAEPAAREYARLLGKDPGQLTTFTFAAHPVVVRIGGSIMSARSSGGPNGDLVFFSAIDEGLVLTLAEPQDMVAHLDRALSDLSRAGRPGGDPGLRLHPAPDGGDGKAAVWALSGPAARAPGGSAFPPMASS
jgi:hypothetical protein